VAKKGWNHAVDTMRVTTITLVGEECAGSS